jgi:hypothetical protein
MDSFRFDKVSDPLELCRRRSALKLAIGGDEIRAENRKKVLQFVDRGYIRTE